MQSENQPDSNLHSYLIEILPDHLYLVVFYYMLNDKYFERNSSIDHKQSKNFL